MWHYCCVIPYAACIRQLMCIHFPTLRPSLKTTTHQPPTETTWFRIPRLLLVYLKLSNPFNTSPPQIKLSKPTPIHAKHDLCLILLDFLTNMMYERQSSRSTTPFLFSSQLPSTGVPPHSHSLRKEPRKRERCNWTLTLNLNPAYYTNIESNGRKTEHIRFISLSSSPLSSSLLTSNNACPENQWFQSMYCIINKQSSPSITNRNITLFHGPFTREIK